MANKINVEFGGTIPVGAPGELGTLATGYENIATANSLVTLGFAALLPDRANITGISIQYRKEGMAESGLGAFQTLWRSLCTANNITPTETTVEYYVE